MSTGDVMAATANTRHLTVGRTGMAAQATTRSPVRSRYQATSAPWTERIVNGSVATANGGAYR